MIYAVSEKLSSVYACGAEMCARLKCDKESRHRVWMKRAGICVWKTEPALFVAHTQTHSHTHIHSFRRLFADCECVCSGNLDHCHRLRTHCVRVCVCVCVFAYASDCMDVSVCLSIALGVCLRMCVRAHDLYLNIVFVHSVFFSLLPLLLPHWVVILFALRFSVVHSVLWFRTLHTRCLPFFSLRAHTHSLSQIHAVHSLKQQQHTHRHSVSLLFYLIFYFNWFYCNCWEILLKIVRKKIHKPRRCWFDLAHRENSVEFISKSNWFCPQHEHSFFLLCKKNKFSGLH